MGGDSKILKKLRKDVERTGGPGGPEPIVLMHTKLPAIVGPSVYIEDTLTRVLYNPGENQSWFTGQEFYNMWVKPLLYHLGPFGSTHAVSSFDDPENVPREKAKTQLARVIANAKSKAKKKKESEESGIPLPSMPVYSHDMQFCDEGIYDPKVGRAETVTHFHMQAVTGGDRRLRKALWNYLFDKLKSQQLPDDRVIYIETEARGPHKFTGSEDFVRDEKAAHGHGESDPSCSFWLEYLCMHEPEGKTGIVRGKDMDHFLLILNAIEMQVRHAPLGYVHAPVYWIFKRDEIYDMRLARKRIITKYKFSVSHFTIYCALGGSDYYEKKLLTHNCTLDQVFDAFDMVKQEFDIWDTTLELGETQEDRDKKEEKALITFCRQLYQNIFTGTVKGQLAVVRTAANAHVNLHQHLFSYERISELSEQKGSKKWQLPSLATIHKAYLQLRFQYRYWRDRSRWPKHMFGRTKQSSVSDAQQSHQPVTASPHFPVTAPAAAAAASSQVKRPPPRRMRTAEQAEQDTIDLTAYLFEDEPMKLDPSQYVDENGKHQCIRCSYKMGIVHQYCSSCQSWLMSGKSFPVIKKSNEDLLNHEEVKKVDDDGDDDDMDALVASMFSDPAPPGGPSRSKQTKIQLATTVAASSASSSSAAYTAEDIARDEERHRKIWGAPPPPKGENWCECGAPIPITKGKCDDCRKMESTPKPRVSAATVIEAARPVYKKRDKNYAMVCPVCHSPAGMQCDNKTCRENPNKPQPVSCLSIIASSSKAESLMKTNTALGRALREAHDVEDAKSKYTTREYQTVEQINDDVDAQMIAQLDADEQAAADELSKREAEADKAARHEHNTKCARDLAEKLDSEAKRFKADPPAPPVDQPSTRSAAGFVCHRPLANLMRSGAKRC